MITPGIITWPRQKLKNILLIYLTNPAGYLSGRKLSSVEIRTLGHAIDGTSSKKPKYSQNGVKFRTICPDCNNVKLGASYDPDLVSLCNGVSTYLRAVVETGLYVGQKKLFATKPQRIAKAIVGHLLAGCVPENYGRPLLSAPVPDALRSYFLNSSAAFPANMNIYYWLHPSKIQILMNYFTYCDIKTKDMISGSVLKFFPLAFLVVWDQPKSVKLNANNLLPANSYSLDQISELEVDFSKIMPSLWPETVGDHNFLLTKDEITLVAKEKPKRPRCR